MEYAKHKEQEAVSRLVGKTITAVNYADCFQLDYEELVLTFSDGTSIKLTGSGSSCGCAGYLEIEASPMVRDVPMFDPLLWQMA